MVSNIDPLQRIQAEGFAYRSAVEGPPRLVVVFGIWLLFAPIVIGAAIMLAYALSEDLGQTISAGFTAFFLLFPVGLAVLLYRTAKKNIAKSREAGEAEDNRVIDLGNWVFIAPTLMIAVAIVLYLFSDTILSAAVFLILMLPTVCSVVVIYRTTKNFIVKSRAANKANDELIN